MLLLLLRTTTTVAMAPVEGDHRTSRTCGETMGSKKCSADMTPRRERQLQPALSQQRTCYRCFQARSKVPAELNALKKRSVMPVQWQKSDAALPLAVVVDGKWRSSAYGLSSPRCSEHTTTHASKGKARLCRENGRESPRLLQRAPAAPCRS